MAKGGAGPEAGGPPSNPSELFTGQFLPTSHAIADSQQLKFPHKTMCPEAENRIERQSDLPPG